MLLLSNVRQSPFEGMCSSFPDGRLRKSVTPSSVRLFSSPSLPLPEALDIYCERAAVWF